jgi:hypothetical protein
MHLMQMKWLKFTKSSNPNSGLDNFCDLDADLRNIEKIAFKPHRETLAHEPQIPFGQRFTAPAAF